MSNAQNKNNRPPKRACEYCKKKHIKCDGNTPCYQCERRNLSCEYPNKVEITNPTKKSLEEPIDLVPIEPTLIELVNSTTADFPALNSNRKRKEPDKKRKKTKEYKFVPIQSENINNNSIIVKSPVDGSWLDAYKLNVGPFVSKGSHDLTDITKFSRILTSDFYKLKTISNESLLRILNQYAQIAHGSRYCLNPEVSVRSAYKALDIIEVLLSNKVHTIPEYVRSFSTSIESIIFYLTGHGDLYKARELVTHAHNILNNFGELLLPSTRRTVYSFLIGKTLDIDEMELWWKKGNDVPTIYSQTDISSWVFLALFLSTNPLVNLDTLYLPNMFTVQDDVSFKNYQFILRVIEQAEKIVWSYEESLNQLPDSNHRDIAISKIFKYVLYGPKAYVLCKCGLLDDAIAYANEVIQYGIPDMCRLPFLFSLYHACVVSKFLNKSGLYNQGVENLQVFTQQYPLWKSQLEGLFKSYQNPDMYITQSPLYNESYESDGSTNEYKSPSTIEEYPSMSFFNDDKDNLEKQLSLVNEYPFSHNVLDI